MIDFVKYQVHSAILSVIMILIPFGVYLYKLQTRGAGFDYSVDFTGGAQVLLKFDSQISPQAVREILEKEGFQGVTTREFSQQEVLVRVKQEAVEKDAAGIGQQMVEIISRAMPNQKPVVMQVESVGPEVGSALKYNATVAVVIALVLMLLYIAFRFWSFAFATGAVIALAHDALIMLGFLVLLDKEVSINVIGAILAVLGYSINDTIVIFAQIRQNLKTMKNASLAHVVNTSINQTLRRTILTSFATTLVVLVMFLFGGEVLRDFSFTLLIGIIFGTFSSIYIASPVMMLLYR